MGSFQIANIQSVELNFIILFKKSLGLLPSQLVEIGIDPTALHDTLSIEIGFAMSNQIYFHPTIMTLIRIPPSRCKFDSLIRKDYSSADKVGECYVFDIDGNNF